jgi:hypothetical protein
MHSPVHDITIKILNMERDVADHNCRSKVSKNKINTATFDGTITSLFPYRLHLFTRVTQSFERNF